MLEQQKNGSAQDLFVVIKKLFPYALYLNAHSKMHVWVGGTADSSHLMLPEQRSRTDTVREDDRRCTRNPGTAHGAHKHTHTPMQTTHAHAYILTRIHT